MSELLSDVTAQTSQDSSPALSNGAASSAETQNTDAAPEEQLPFHTHPRWKQLQSELKEHKQRVTDLQTAAEYGQSWQQALQNPEFASQVQQLIDRQMQAPPAQADPMQQMQQKVQSLEHQTLLSQHIQHFNQHRESLKVPKEFQPVVEQAVWNFYRQYDPSAMQPNGQLSRYNADAFERALTSATQAMQQYRQSVIDGYTQQKLSDRTPSVNSGGVTAKAPPHREHQEEVSDFIQQLKGLTG